MHGVQPKANAAPMSGGPKYPNRRAPWASILRSLITGVSHSGVHTAVTAMNRPIRTMTHPAMMLNTGFDRNDDSEVAVAPSPTNTRVKPRTNRPVMPVTRRIETLPSDRSCIEYPDINEMYPGMSGSTHGDRNDAAPASTAATRLTSDKRTSAPSPGSTTVPPPGLFPIEIRRPEG